MSDVEANREVVPAAAPDEKIRILLVDDHPIVRQGLTHMIDDEPDLTVCGEAEDAAEGLALAERLRPDLAIIDISLGGADGLELLKEIRNRLPALTTLVLSMHDESLYAERALRAGAKGYVSKHDAPQVLLTAIRRVLAGEVYLSEGMAAKVLRGLSRPRPDDDDDGGPLDCLSNRELQVFRLIGDGMSVRNIAERLFLSPKTIETHRDHIKGKLDLVSSHTLLRYAVEHRVATA
jgi:DNA-binding NarL/FixJ family response regulator